MNRYKWLAQYVLRMRNKEIPVLVDKHPLKTVYFLPRLTLIKESDFLGDDYWLKFTMPPKRDWFPTKVKVFRISEKDYNTIMEGFK